MNGKERNAGNQRPREEVRLARARAARCARRGVALCVGLTLLASAGAAVGQDSTAFLPPTKAILQLEKKLYGKGSTAISGIISCQLGVVMDAAKKKPYDEPKLDACLAKKKAAFEAAMQGGVPIHPGDPPTQVPLLSEAGSVDAAFDQIDLTLRRSLGELYCCGAEHLPGNFVGYAPDPVAASDPTCTFSNVHTAGRALQSFTGTVAKCEATNVDRTFKGKPFNVEDCDNKASTTLHKKIAKISLPGCAQPLFARARDARGLPGAEDQILDSVKQHAINVAPPVPVGAGTPTPAPLDDWGCCENGIACSDVPSSVGLSATCTGFSTPHQFTTCNVSTGHCATQIDTCAGCPYPKGYSECPSDCPTPTPLPTGVPTPIPTPAPFCGDGICNGTETCQCSDCPPCKCGDGVRSGLIGRNQPGDEDCEVGVPCPPLSIGSGVTVTGVCHLNLENPNDPTNCKCEFCPAAGASVDPPTASVSCVCSRGYSCPPCPDPAPYGCFASCPAGEYCASSPSNGGVCINNNNVNGCIISNTCCSHNSNCLGFEYCAPAVLPSSAPCGLVGTQCGGTCPAGTACQSVPSNTSPCGCFPIN